MIRLNQEASVPKTYTSVNSYLTELQKDVSSIVYLLLGSGLDSVSISDLAATFNISTTADVVNLTSDYGEKVFASFKVLGDETYKGVMVSDKLNGVAKEIILFDEAGKVENGSVGNPITVEYPKQTQLLTDYSIPEIASIVYVNGTPQPRDYIQVVTTDKINRRAQIGFRKIIGGMIFPDPIKPDGQFSATVLRGYLADWFSDFGDPIKLKFSNLDLLRTNKPLILELYDIDTDTRKYFLVNPEFVSGKPYYSVIETYTIEVHIPTEITDTFPPSSTLAYIYFADTLELTSFGGENKFYRQYKMPITDLLPDYEDLKIFAISRSTGEIVELVGLSNILLGSMYSLDYKSGTLNIYNIGGKIPNDVYIAVAGFKYEPPLKPYHTSDYTNTVSLYYDVGGTFVLSSTPESTLYVYLVPRVEYIDVVSYRSDDGKIVTAPQMQTMKLNFFISSTTITSYLVKDQSKYFGDLSVEPIFLGELHRSGSTYTFTPSSLADSPYNRLLELVGNMPLITANSYSTAKTTEIETIPVTAVKIIPIDYIHNSVAEIAFYGVSGKLKITYEGTSPATEKSWQIELGYYDHNTNVFTPVYTVGTGSTSVAEGHFDITDPAFPTASLWGTTSPATGIFLALRITVTDTASGETEYKYDYSLSIYYNFAY